jgi:hypothetical protein
MAVLKADSHNNYKWSLPARILPKNTWIKYQIAAVDQAGNKKASPDYYIFAW